MVRFFGCKTCAKGGYSYTGNQLQGIAGLTGTYVYEANGNATIDGRTEVALAYNHLNLPITASRSGLSMAYTYDATGKKLRKLSMGSSTVTTDYVDGIQYTNGTIDFIQTGEGIARNNGGVYSYEYNLTDHLGNVRASFDIYGGTVRILQRDDYYAFGLRKSAVGGTNKYLYNGKELQEELEQYDYGARLYDPVIGRWNVVDPLAEMYQSGSPYNYVMNNPLKFNDPTGMFSTHTDEDGNVVAVYEDGDKGVYKHEGNRKEVSKELKENCSKKNTSAGGQKMGETEFIDEFISPETGKALTDTKIQFGKSFDPIVKKMNETTKEMDLKEIASESRGGGSLDLKKDYPNTGALLNGKYATSRSGGNFLAGLNAAGGTYFGKGISFNTFQRLAGALHVVESEGGTLSNYAKGKIVLGNIAYGPPPAYGEVMYQYRMSKLGWEKAKR